MDDLTHVLAGALIAQTNPSQKKGLVLACVLGAAAPDLDVILSLFNHQLYVLEHRGFTHSLWGILPVVLFAAWMAWLFVRKKSDCASFSALFGMALAGDLSHLALDGCTSWGTMFLWPNRTRFALDYFFIIDIWYLLLLIIPLVLCIRFRAKRVTISLVGILFLLSYHGLTAYTHHQALRVAEEVQSEGECIALPEPLSPFRWSIFSRQERKLRSAHLDFLKPSETLSWQSWEEPRSTPEIIAAFQSPQIKNFMWFARVPMWEEEKRADGSSIVKFWDGRFQATFGRLGQTNTRRFGASVVVRNGTVVNEQTKGE
jgi:inner membrane protein